MILIYLAKKTSNENIQTVSDEDKMDECEFCNILCQCFGVGRQLFKRKCKGSTQPNLHRWGLEAASILLISEVEFHQIPLLLPVVAE